VKYKKEWKGWGDFLGTGTVAPKDMQFRSFDKARKFAQSLGLKSQKEWFAYCKTNKKPSDIPQSPNGTYKKEWKTWGDWLGTGRIATQSISQSWLSWKEAKPLYRKIAKEKGISNKTEWLEYLKTHKLPKGLPTYPNDVYTKEHARKMMK